MSAKAFYDRSVPTRNLISTISGVVILVLSALSLFGIITPEQQQTLGTYALDIIGIVVGILNMFKLTDA